MMITFRVVGTITAERTSRRDICWPCAMTGATRAIAVKTKTRAVNFQCRWSLMRVSPVRRQRPPEATTHNYTNDVSGVQRFVFIGTDKLSHGAPTALNGYVTIFTDSNMIRR